MASLKNAFRLVVYQHQLDPHIFREIIADSLKLNRTDAMRLVSYAPGILPWPLSRRRAARVARLLASVGVQVGVWHHERLPRLVDPCHVHRVACQSSGLASYGIRGEMLHWVPWAQLELISVGEFSADAKETCPFGPIWFSASVGAVRALVMGRRRVAVQRRKTQPPSQPELWLVRRRPTQIICIHQDQVNYEYLQDRRQSSARANFRLLIQDLIRLAPHATVTPATHSFVAFERPGRYRFDGRQHFKQYTTWQLLVRWRDRSQGGEMGPPGDYPDP